MRRRLNTRWQLDGIRRFRAKPDPARPKGDPEIRTLLRALLDDAPAFGFEGASRLCTTLANELGVHPTTVYRWAHGRRAPSAGHFAALRTLLYRFSRSLP